MKMPCFTKHKAVAVLAAVLALTLSACAVEPYGRHRHPTDSSDGSDVRSSVTTEDSTPESASSTTEPTTATETQEPTETAPPSTPSEGSTTPSSEEAPTETPASEPQTEPSETPAPEPSPAGDGEPNEYGLYPLPAEHAGSPLRLELVPRDVPGDAWTEKEEGQWSRWPETSSIPLEIRGNFEVFRDRADSDRPLEGALVFLDPGHGGWDPGATYQEPGGLVRETDITLNVGLKAKKMLEDLGARVIITRREDETCLLYKRIAMIGSYALDELERIAATADPSTLPDLSWTEEIRQSLDQMIRIHDDAPHEDLSQSGRGLAQGIGVGAPLRRLMDLQKELKHMIFVSIHVNSVGEATKHNQGLIVYFFDSDTMWTIETYSLNRYLDGGNPKATPIDPVYMNYDTSKARSLGARIFRGFEEVIPEMLRQTYFEEHGTHILDLRAGNYGVIRESNLRSLLVEMGFITDERDRAVMTSDEGTTGIARGLTEGIRYYYAEKVWEE